MSISKSNKNQSFKTQLYFDLGELVLIVMGVLLALFLNNFNAEFQYKKKIDKNILSVHNELGEYIESARRQIEDSLQKDSLI